ncbi:MAG: Gfo/Idh/MocA family oxidoreductase [Phycisphaerae bacterium]|nr:Gfo/Idh/MocA family oxidoreductase [Phycisphaerae bacterium]
MLNVAVVGMGNIGNAHARCYQRNKHVKMVAVCDISPERVNAAAKALECRPFGSIRDMLSSGIPIDAVSMTTGGKENGGDHYQATVELLTAGIPVLGEKPISNEIAQAREMVALGQAKHVPYAINLNHRFTPAARQAKLWLDQGRLGAINIIKMTLWINNPNESSPYFHIRALHPHSIDVLRYFGGDIARVQAFFKKGPGRNIWSNVLVNVQFASGTIGHLTGSYDAGIGYGLETCELMGTDARVVIEEACQRLRLQHRHSKEAQVFENLGGMTSADETFQSRIDAWVDDLLKKTPPEKIDGKAEDALKAQLAIEAAIESWDKGTVVTVPPV